MRTNTWLAIWGMAGAVALASPARAQVRPYVGFAYPAGGQQGTTVQIRLGGQGLDDVNAVAVSGTGIIARVVEWYRRLDYQEYQLLREQMQALRGTNPAAAAPMGEMMMMTMAAEAPTPGAGGTAVVSSAAAELLAALDRRISSFAPLPTYAALTTVVLVEVTIAPGAAPGVRELRLVTVRGVSNPVEFHVSQWPECCRKPMVSAALQVLGKEAQSLRKRPPEEVEDRITVPCVANGQIASGEVNRYRFAARKGQRLVLTTQARQLVPFIADAVPGWFQPVLVLYDANGREAMYADDYRFKPDPTICYDVPQDGEYGFAIYDALYRGREDYVYRVTIGEVPVVTSLFPLGARAGESVAVKMKGWNLDGAELSLPASDSPPGVYSLAARRRGFESNRVPFALDTLPEGFEQEPNNDPAHARRVHLPLIVNGRIDRPDDRDVFRFVGQSNDTVVAEVCARRLDSPLDSVLRLTDARGRLVAFNDDHEDLASGLNTHHADSYLMATLPADGAYSVQLADAARRGGEEYAYRLRISAPQPDFALRVVPSSVSVRSRNMAALSVYALRKDGFAGAIELALKNPPSGFSAAPAVVPAGKPMGTLVVKTDRVATQELVRLVVEGRATIGEGAVVHEAVPAEDRMQAFLWRHLVPARDLDVLVFDPSYQPPPKRVAPVLTSSAAEAKPAATNAAAAPTKFTKQQAAYRLSQLKRLYEEGLLTDAFYAAKAAECGAPQ